MDYPRRVTSPRIRLRQEITRTFLEALLAAMIATVVGCLGGFLLFRSFSGESTSPLLFGDAAWQAFLLFFGLAGYCFGAFWIFDSIRKEPSRSPRG